MDNEDIVKELKEDTTVTKSDTPLSIEDHITHDPTKLEQFLKLLPCEWVKALVTGVDEHKLLLNDKSILFVNHIEDVSQDAQNRIWIKFTLPRRRGWYPNTPDTPRVLNDQIPNKTMAIPSEFIAAVMPFSCKHDGYLHRDTCGDCDMPVDDIMRIANEGFVTSKRFIDDDPSIKYANYGNRKTLKLDMPVPKYAAGDTPIIEGTEYLITDITYELTYKLAYPNDPDTCIAAVTEEILLAHQPSLNNTEPTPEQEEGKDEK